MRVSVCNRNEILLEKLRRYEEVYARKTGGFTREMLKKEDRTAVMERLAKEGYDLLMIQIDLRKRENLERFRQWMEAGGQKDDQKRCVWTFNREVIALDQEEIYYLETYQRKTYVHTCTRTYRISTTLKAEEDRLSSYEFIRIHQGYLVRVDRICKVEHHQVFLDNGSVLPVSFRRERNLVSRLLGRSEIVERHGGEVEL